MIYLVFGSRSFGKAALLEKTLDILIDSNDIIITGGASGADILAKEYADRHKLECKIFKPDYNTYGSIAPLIRNGIMAETAHEGICFYDGISRGTIHTIQELSKRGKHTEVYGFK